MRRFENSKTVRAKKSKPSSFKLPPSSARCECFKNGIHICHRNASVKPFKPRSKLTGSSHALRAQPSEIAKFVSPAHSFELILISVFGVDSRGEFPWRGNQEGRTARRRQLEGPFFDGRSCCRKVTKSTSWAGRRTRSGRARGPDEGREKARDRKQQVEANEQPQNLSWSALGHGPAVPEERVRGLWAASARAPLHNS